MEFAIGMVIGVILGIFGSVGIGLYLAGRFAETHFKSSMRDGVLIGRDRERLKNLLKDPDYLMRTRRELGIEETEHLIALANSDDPDGP